MFEYDRFKALSLANGQLPKMKANLMARHRLVAGLSLEDERKTSDA